MVTRPSRTPVNCPVCGKKIGRKADLSRHMKIHASNKDDLMHCCHFLGCAYKTLQLSNLETHLNTHTGQRPNKCPTEGCDFSCADPGSLTRHRKEIHGYEPKANSGSQASTGAHRAARQRPRVSPYPTPSSTSRGSSVRPISPSDISSGVYHTPRPQLRILDPCPTLPVPDAQKRVMDRMKNSSAAFSTHLITKHVSATVIEHLRSSSVAFSSHLVTKDAPTTEPKSLPPNSGLLVAQEALMVDHQLPKSDEGDLYSADVPAQPARPLISNEVTNAVFDSFLARFDDSQTEATPAYAAPSLPTSVAQYEVGNTTVTSLPQSVEGYTHTVGGAPVSTQLQYVDGYHHHNPVASVSPPYIDGNQYTANGYHSPADSVPPTYDNYTGAPYGYATEEISFNAQFSQPNSFAAPDIGAHPQVFDPTYMMFTTPMGVSSFTMQGLYAY